MKYRLGFLILLFTINISAQEAPSKEILQQLRDLEIQLSIRAIDLRKGIDNQAKTTRPSRIRSLIPLFSGLILSTPFALGLFQTSWGFHFMNKYPFPFVGATALGWVLTVYGSMHLAYSRSSPFQKWIPGKFADRFAEGQLDNVRLAWPSKNLQKAKFDIEVLNLSQTPATQKEILDLMKALILELEFEIPKDLEHYDRAVVDKIDSEGEEQSANFELLSQLTKSEFEARRIDALRKVVGMLAEVIEEARTVSELKLNDLSACGRAISKWKGPSPGQAR